MPATKLTYRIAAALILCIGAVGSLPATERWVAYLPYAEFVDEYHDNRSHLWVVDLGDGTVLARVEVGPMWGDIQVVDGMARVFVLAHPTDASSEIVAVSTRTLEIVDRIELPWTAKALEYDEVEELLYTLRSDGNQLVAIDPRHGVTATYDLSQNARGLRMIRGSRWLMLQTSSLNSLIWDLDNASPGFSLPSTYRSPMLSSDGSRIYAMSAFPESLHEFDVSNGQMLRVTPTPSLGRIGILEHTDIDGVLRLGSGRGMGTFHSETGVFQHRFPLPGQTYTSGVAFVGDKLVVAAPNTLLLCLPMIPCDTTPPPGYVWVVDTHTGEIVLDVALPRGGALVSGRFVGRLGIPPTAVAIDAVSAIGRLLLALGILGLALRCFRRKAGGGQARPSIG
ncbi:MAG TPA: hypothetical protein PKZ76_13655 [Xanthomonadaceae bacterium]|nr:hypothetical protein [Xanthomonadaceae bacterium]